MLLHFIHFKGKGFWVIIMPLISAIVMFQMADFLPINKNLIGAFALIVSGVLLFLIDNRRPTITEGDIILKKVKLPRVKNRNTMMWIEVRLWGLLMLVIGVIWLIKLVG